MILGMKKLKRTMQKAPAAVRAEARKAVVKSVNEGVALAKTLAPDVTGVTKANIRAKYDADFLAGSVEAAAAEKQEQVRAKAIEFGRKKGEKGTTDPHPYIQPTQEYLGKRFKNRVSRAIRKGVRSAGG